MEDDELDFNDPNAGSQEETPVVESPGTNTEQPNTDQPSVNPAWSELLEQVPTGFHGLITPHLKKWDQGVQEQFRERAERERQYQEQLARFEPYNELLEGTKPDQLKAARVLLDQLATDPTTFIQRLVEHYGYTPQQAANAAQQAINNGQQAQFGEDDDDDYGQQLDPRFDTLAQQQQAILEHIQQQEAQKVQEQANQEIASELAELNNAIEGGLSPIDKREVLQRAVMMAQTNPNVRLVDAWNQWQDVQRQMFENSPNRSAPQVLSSSGSANPVTPVKKPSEMSDREFQDDLISALRGLGS